MDRAKPRRKDAARQHFFDALSRPDRPRLALVNELKLAIFEELSDILARPIRKMVRVTNDHASEFAKIARLPFHRRNISGTNQYLKPADEMSMQSVRWLGFRCIVLGHRRFDSIQEGYEAGEVDRWSVCPDDLLREIHLVVFPGRAVCHTRVEGFSVQLGLKQRRLEQVFDASVLARQLRSFYQIEVVRDVIERRGGRKIDVPP